MLQWFTYGLRGLRSKVLTLGLCLISSAAVADRVHLMALGDSLTQGYGLIEQEGFVPRLRDWLSDRGYDVRVVNAGVSGDTTAGGLARIEWSLTKEITGIIVALGGNDLLRGIDPAVSRANIEGILKIARAREIEVLLVGMQAPGNYGPEYKASFDAIFPELSDAYGTLYLDSFFAGLAATPEAMSDAMQADGIHPNAEGVLRIVDRFGPEVEALIARILAK